MWWVVLVVALSACESIFPLDGPPSVTLRDTFSASAQQSTQLVFSRSPKVASGDLLVAVVEVENNTFPELTPSSEWDVFAEFHDSCGGAWHSWFLRAVAESTTSYTFDFDSTHDYAGIITAYANASSATSLEAMAFMADNNSQTVLFPASTGPRSSVVWMGGVQEDPFTTDQTPSGTTRQASVRNVAVFDRVTADGNLPETSVLIPGSTCMGMAQVRVEP